jgi:3-isopropylmalate dehydrogenase
LKIKLKKISLGLIRMIKVKKRSILLLPGDGIGPEVIKEVEKIIKWFNENQSLDFQIEKDLVGGASYEKHKKPITDEVFYKALESEAVILGAVGGPKWDNLEFSKRPERALLKLRKELKLFANLRPAICFKQLVDASSLKPEIVSGLDIMIVRELTGGIYFGEPRGIKPIENGERKGINTHTYTSSEIIRVARVAFELAQKRNKKVTSCDKSNVMEAGILWREEVQKVGDEDYPKIELKHMLADNCAMQLLRDPKQFDVIVTDNLFGDILSDEAAMLTGSLGLLPSASLGAKDKNGKMRSMYEPVHGSAPDIAGTGRANPIASILSFAMALRYSFDLEKEADILENAVQKVLDQGLRTKDILSKGKKEVSTTQMGDAIITKLK